MPANQGKTATFTVTNNATPVAVIAATDTQEIRIMEDKSVVGWPTTDYQIAIPASNSPAIQMAAGVQYQFVKGGKPGAPNGMFKKGEVAGYVRVTDVASTTFQQVEPGVQGGN